MRIAAGLAAAYTGGQPFHLWLANEFRNHRSFGSKDRRFYREMLYAWLRLGNWGHELPLQARLLAGWMRVHPEDTDMGSLLREQMPMPGNDGSFKGLCAALNAPYAPYASLGVNLEPGLRTEELDEWFGSPAPVWLRVYPGREAELEKWLSGHEINFEKSGPAYLLPAGTGAEEVISRGMARVQDLGSQLSLRSGDVKEDDVMWDACCGAGGKSLLLRELAPGNTLFISDMRSGIIENALARFRAAGYPEPHSGINDLSRPLKTLQFEPTFNFSAPVFDVIVCDVPCTGSGTWRRNPENMAFFRPGKEKEYAGLQYSIVKSAISFLKPGGRLIYLTCSLFEAENSGNIERFIHELDLRCEEKEMTGGFEKNVDYLFRARLIKN